MNYFTERTIDIIKNIPDGMVMTYGQIARLAGNPRGARQVVRILHSMSKKYRLPWHRVVNSKGGVNFEEQQLMLEMEAVELTKNRCVNLEHYQCHPDR